MWTAAIDGRAAERNPIWDDTDRSVECPAVQFPPETPSAQPIPFESKGLREHLFPIPAVV